MAIEETDQVDLGASPTHDEKKRRRGMFFLALATLTVGIAFNIQIGLNDNFVVGQIGVSPFQKGILESVRESCGIWALGLLALLAGLAEPIIASIMLLLVAVGLGSYYGVHDFFWLAAMSVVWSQGLHVWMPLPNSMMLSLAEKGRTGHRLGQLQAAGAVGGVGGLVVAFLLTTFAHVSIRPLYLVSGAAAVLAAIAILGVPRDIKTPGPRLVVRRKYALYYVMNFLEGWRKQIFVAFAGFLLVNNHNMPLRNMLIMWAAVGAAQWFVSPLVGRLIDRVGERTVLTGYYATMTLLFLGYIFIHDRRVLMGLFVADGIFFSLAMALTTYVRRIAPPEEHTPTLSMGVAMNHVAAVAMPLAGAFLWKYAGYQWPFAAGAAAAAASILVVRRLPKHNPHEHEMTA